MKYKLSEIAERIGAELHGDPSMVIRAFAPLHKAVAGTITFASTVAYRQALESTAASAALVAPSLLPYCPVSALVVSDVAVAQAKCAALFSEVVFQSGVHPTAVVDPSASVSSSAYIGPYCVIEAGVKIGSRSVISAHTVLCRDVQLGDDCLIHPNVTCYSKVRLADRVIVHSGAVIGADGFGLANDNGKWLKIAHLGTVDIGDDVEIGASTTIDRGTMEDTIIEQGAKLDNQVHVGHNVRVGANTAIAGCTGIAGSSVIGKNCILAGMVGVADHVTLADSVILTAKTGVTKDISRPGVYSSTIPAQPIAVWRRVVGRLKHLDSFCKRLCSVERKND